MKENPQPYLTNVFLIDIIFRERQEEMKAVPVTQILRKFCGTHFTTLFEEIID
jgi:hypothetical protein